MGGLNEETIQASTGAAKRTGKGSGVATIHQPGALQAIRRHEDPATGQVHFHVDAEGLKVGIPTSRWIGWWQEIVDRGPGPSHTYYDRAHGTVLTITLVEEPVDAQTVRLEAEFRVARVTMGPTFASMDQFSQI